MDATDRRRWFRAVLLVSALYIAAGVVFGILAQSAASHQERVAWRLAAWVMSAVAFAAHLWHEHSRLRNPPRTAAWHVALAAALGAFGLAAAANVHAHWVAPTGQRPFALLALALLVWPVITVVPAFLVALAAATVLARTRRTMQA